MNKTVIKNALILAAFTLVCGLALGLVYNITKSRIEEVNLAATQEAYREVFEEADTFEAVEYDADAANALVADAGYSDTIDDVQAALSADGETLGYVITVTAKDGSQGSITLCAGILNDGTFNGFSITDTSETPGLGLKASDEDFAGQFRDKIVEAFSIVKNSGYVDESKITAISGATITSEAVANACNAAIVYFNELTGGGEDE